MADAYKTLYRGQLPSSAAAQYTVPGSTAAIIKHITIYNNDSSTRTFSLYRNGTTAAYIFASGSIVAGGSAEWDGTMALEAAGYIAGVGSVASQLTIIIDGDEVT